MRRYKLAAHILVTLSVFNFVLTAPVTTLRGTCADMADKGEDTRIVSGKRAEDGEDSWSGYHGLTRASPNSGSKSVQLSSSSQHPRGPTSGYALDSQEMTNPTQLPSSTSGGVQRPPDRSGGTELPLNPPDRSRVKFPLEWSVRTKPKKLSSKFPPEWSVRTKPNRLSSSKILPGWSPERISSASSSEVLPPSEQTTSLSPGKVIPPSEQITSLSSSKAVPLSEQTTPGSPSKVIPPSEQITLPSSNEVIPPSEHITSPSSSKVVPPDTGSGSTTTLASLFGHDSSPSSTKVVPPDSGSESPTTLASLFSHDSSPSSTKVVPPDSGSGSTLTHTASELAGWFSKLGKPKFLRRISATAVNAAQH